VNGFAQGAFYALIAVGFSIIFGVARMFKLSIGGYFVLGAYTAYWLTKMTEMDATHIRDQPTSNITVLTNKLIIGAPVILFIFLIFYFFRLYGKRVGSILFVGNLILLFLHMLFLLESYSLANFDGIIQSFFVVDSILIFGLALQYMELSRKQVLSGMTILHVLAIILNILGDLLSTISFPQSPAVYIAIFLTSIIIVAGISMFVDRFLLDKARDNPTNVLIITFGIALLIQSIIPILKYPERGEFVRFDIIQRNLDGIISKTDTTVISQVSIQTLRVISAFASIAIIILIYFFLKHTPMGRAMEAVSEDPEAAWLVGINVRKVYLIATGLGMGLAAAAAILTTPFIHQPYWGVYMGWAPLIFAIAVVTLGGLGSIFGSAIAGFMIGFAGDTIAVRDPQLSRVIPLIAIFLIMLIRPNGLFGVEEEDE
jgi:branched-chain amino acid transport system permease protein